MATSREIVCREFKNQNKLFLNYESQKAIALGDIITWDGRQADFSVVNRLSNLSITPAIQTSSIKSDMLYNSNKGVRFGFEGAGRTGLPTMGFSYAGASRYSLQAFDTTIESLDEVKLAADITNAIKDGNSWDNDWIVVTSLWNADAYTQLVAGGRKAEAGICATAGVDNAFNIADVSLSVALGYGSELASQQIASRGSCPFFIGMKYRVQVGKIPHMVRYGGK